MPKKKKPQEERYVIVGKMDNGIIPAPSFNARMISSTIDVVIFTFVMLFFAKIIPWPISEKAQLAVINMRPEELRTSEQLLVAIKYYLFEAGGLMNIVMQFLLTFAIAALYVLPFWFYYGTTPGKMALGMKIVDEKTGAAPSKKQYIVRFASYFISFALAGFGFLWIGLNKKKRAWHDIFSGTAVVYKKKPRFAV